MYKAIFILFSYVLLLVSGQKSRIVFGRQHLKHIVQWYVLTEIYHFGTIPHIGGIETARAYKKFIHELIQLRNSLSPKSLLYFYTISVLANFGYDTSHNLAIIETPMESWAKRPYTFPSQFPEIDREDVLDVFPDLIGSVYLTHPNITTLKWLLTIPSDGIVGEELAHVLVQLFLQKPETVLKAVLVTPKVVNTLGSAICVGTDTPAEDNVCLKKLKQIQKKGGLIGEEAARTIKEYKRINSQ